MSEKFSRAYDIFGNMALVKFAPGTKVISKRKFASKLLKGNKSITTVLEKTRAFKGRLRKQQTKWIAGEKTKEILYRENNCVFRFNIDSTYFSPRLSNERKELVGKVKKGDNVLVMFAGVGPYSIVIAKNSKARKVYSNEINRKANRYTELNITLNKLKGKVIMLNGNVKQVANKVMRGFSVNKENAPKKFDIIVMPRPQLKDSFLKEAFSLSKKGTRIYYYDFCKGDEIKDVMTKVNIEAIRAKKKIKILSVKKAGEIAPYRFRIRIDIKVL